MNEAQARGLLQAVLDASNGRAATYVPLAQVISSVVLSEQDSAALFAELAARRWIHFRGQSIAVSKAGVEFAIDWTSARQVLEAIRDLAIASPNAATGDSEEQVEEERALARLAMPRPHAKALLNELILLGFASRGMTWDTQVPLVRLTELGRELLGTGQTPPRPE